MARCAVNQPDVYELWREGGKVGGGLEMADKADKCLSFKILAIEVGEVSRPCS